MTWKMMMLGVAFLVSLVGLALQSLMLSASATGLAVTAMMMDDEDDTEEDE